MIGSGCGVRGRIGRGNRVRGGIRRRCGVRGRVRCGNRVRGRIRARFRLGCRLLSQGEGHEARLSETGLVHGHDTDNRAVVLAVDREGQLGAVFLFDDGPRIGALALDLPEQGGRRSAGCLGLDRDLRAFLGGDGAERAVTGDLSVLRGVGGHGQRLDDRGFLIIGIRRGSSCGEGLDLRERELTELGGLDDADEARVEALEVDRARAATDSVDLDHVDSVDRSGRRGVEGSCEARRGGDDPEVVQALVAGDSLAVVGGGAVPDVDDAQRVGLAEVDLPPGVGLLAGVCNRAVVPHAVRVAVDGARGGAAPAGRRHGGRLVECEVVAALGDGQGRALRGCRSVGVCGDGVELCAVILERGCQRVHGARGVRNRLPFGRSLGDAVPLNGGGRSA